MSSRRESIAGSPGRCLRAGLPAATTATSADCLRAAAETPEPRPALPPNHIRSLSPTIPTAAGTDREIIEDEVKLEILRLRGYLSIHWHLFRSFAK